MKEELGKVRKVDLFIEDHGILTMFITMEFGSGVQGFGGLVLDGSPPEGSHERVGTAFGLDFILQILRLFKVDRLESIVGRTCYAIRANENFGNIIGLRIPPFDGGGEFMVEEWRKRWMK